MKKIHKKLNNIEYIVVEPAYIKPDMMYPVIFLLHGYGSNMSDLANICEHIDSNEYAIPKASPNRHQNTHPPSEPRTLNSSPINSIILGLFLRFLIGFQSIHIGNTGHFSRG